MVVKNLTFQEQIELLKSRGIIVKNVEKSSKKIENISYYKLKEYATPFICAYIDGSPKYKGLEFDELLERYYQDKNLRIHLFHVIEKIEVSLKTRIAYNLGNMNAYGYLETNKWINKTERNAYRKYKKDFEYIFEKHSKFEKSSSDLALIICILKNLVDVINPKYKWKYIRANILSLVRGSDDKARILGFNDKDSVYKLLGKRTCTKK